jgi:hypothetical protein
MRSIILLSSLALVLAACGDDGGDDDQVDAAAAVDAPTGTIDAPPAADAPPSATYNLTLTLMGYGMAHNGDTLYFTLWDDADSSAPVATTEKEIMSGGGGGGGGGSNAIDLPGVLVEGHSYTLYWYADLNDNMTCDMDTDHHWHLAIPEVTGPVAESHQHTTTFDGDCTRH